VIASVGLCIVDVTLTVDRLPTRGESLNTTGMSVSDGGKAANQLVAAARLGRKTALIGRGGAPFLGRSPLASLQREGVDVRHVRDTTADAGFSMILLTPGGEQLIITHNGPGADVDLPSVAAAIDDLDPGILLLQGEVDPDATVQIGHSFEETVILDPSPVDPFVGMDLSFASILTPNLSEAQRLTGMAEPTARDVAAATSAHSVVVTQGPRGAEWWHEGTSGREPALQVPVVDPTGAGDAFNGALAAALETGSTFPEAVRLATLVSSWSVQRRHCIDSYPTLEELSQVVPIGAAFEGLLL